MLSEPMTLYKLMNLYMLKQVNFPLTYAQISDFFLSREYTDYFTLLSARRILRFQEQNIKSSRRIIHRTGPQAGAR